MTREDHKLMLCMFAKQTQQIMTLLLILQSKGILEGDDAAAYSYATRIDAPANAAMVKEVANLYSRFALNLGIEPMGNLQDIPDFPGAPPVTPSTPSV